MDYHTLPIFSAKKGRSWVPGDDEFPIVDKACKICEAGKPGNASFKRFNGAVYKRAVRGNLFPIFKIGDTFDILTSQVNQTFRQQASNHGISLLAIDPGQYSTKFMVMDIKDDCEFY